MKATTPVILNQDNTATIVVKNLLTMVSESVSGIHAELYRKLAECASIIKRDFDRSADGDTLTVTVQLLQMFGDTERKTPPTEGGINMENATTQVPENLGVDIIAVAMVCHETNRAWCAANGDDSQLPWHEAPEWQRNSAIMGVRFRLANPNAQEDAQHNAWMEEKIRDGWKYGPVKDAEKKEHNCLVPFNKLPIHQQIKDKLFCSVVDSIFSPNKSTQAPDKTFGEKAAGVGFNPGKNPAVDKIKATTAQAIDQMNDFRSSDVTGEAKRYASTAITNFEIAQMLAVKAITWQG